MFPASRAGLAAGQHQGDVEPGLVHTKPVVDSAVSAASLHQQRRHTRRLRHEHRPPSKEPESGEDSGWRLDDTRQPRTPTPQQTWTGIVCPDVAEVAPGNQ